MNSTHPITKLSDKRFSRPGETVLSSRTKGSDSGVGAQGRDAVTGLGAQAAVKGQAGWRLPRALESGGLSSDPTVFIC